LNQSFITYSLIYRILLCNSQLFMTAVQFVTSVVGLSKYDLILIDHLIQFLLCFFVVF